MAIDFELAKAVFSDADKNRILAIYLTLDNPTHPAGVNWEKATEMYGAASIDSMRVSMRKIFKKLEKGSDETAAGAETAEASPAKTGGKKRKAADDAGEEKTPKKRGRKPKVAATPVKKEEDDNVEEEAEP